MNLCSSSGSRAWLSSLLEFGDEGRVLGTGQPLLQDLQDGGQVEARQGGGVEPEAGEDFALVVAGRAEW